MKKKKKSNNKRILRTAVLAILILGIIILTICIILSSNKDYKKEPRGANVQKYQSEHSTYEVNGWLRVQGTNIDYPVIYPDNGLNINEVVDDFVWVIENEEKLMDRTVILGHNIRNVSTTPLITNPKHTRFEQLLSFAYYDFAKDNQYIQYTKNGKDYIYQIFSISFINERDLAFSGDMDKPTLKKYINQSIEDSYFDYDIEVDENDKIISLITCTRFFESSNYRFKIDGKLLDDGQKAKLKKVKAKRNYTEIENIMKGGKENEAKK